MRKERRFAGALAALVLSAAALALPAASGAAPIPTPTTPTPTSTTTTTTTVVPGTGPAPSTELPTEPAPPGYPVPKPPAKDAPPPPPLTWLTAAQTTGGAVIGKHGTIEQLSVSQAAVKRSQKVVKVAKQRLVDVRTHMSRVLTAISGLERRRDGLLDVARARAIRVYIGGSGDIGIAELAPAASPVDQARKAIYADAAQSVDNATLDDVLHQIKTQHKALDALGDQERDAQQQIAEADAGLTRDKAALDALVNSINDAIHGGRVFPVDGAFDFFDSWGSFRAAASADGSHNHRATDIMAAGNTPIVAVESGTLNRVGWNRLGGWRLWIKGDSGAWFYYAHMRAYAPGLKDGMHVTAGQYLGRVGNTGDAAGGPTHLHFEAHLTVPDGTPSEADKVNPYPLLALLAGAPVPVIPPNETSTTSTTTTTTTTMKTTATTTTTIRRPRP